MSAAAKSAVFGLKKSGELTMPHKRPVTFIKKVTAREITLSLVIPDEILGHFTQRQIDGMARGLEAIAALLSEARRARSDWRKWAVEDEADRKICMVAQWFRAAELLEYEGLPRFPFQE